jgi:hypothetical protein
MLEIGAAVQPHAHEGRFPHRLRQPCEISAQLAAVERKRMDRAALLDAAGVIGVIVRVVLAERELHLGIGLEEAHHGAGVLQKRRDAACIEMVSRFVPDIGRRILDRVFDTGAGSKRVARHPEPSSRSRGGAAEFR